MILSQWFSTVFEEGDQTHHHDYTIRVDTDALTLRVYPNVDGSGTPRRSESCETLEELVALYDEIFQEFRSDYDLFDDTLDGPHPLNILDAIARAAGRAERLAARREPPKRESRWPAIYTQLKDALDHAHLTSDELAEVAREYDVEVTSDALLRSLIYVIDFEPGDAEQGARSMWAARSSSLKG